MKETTMVEIDCDFIQQVALNQEIYYFLQESLLQDGFGISLEVSLRESLKTNVVCSNDVGVLWSFSCMRTFRECVMCLIEEVQSTERYRKRYIVQAEQEFVLTLHFIRRPKVRKQTMRKVIMATTFISEDVVENS